MINKPVALVIGAGAVGRGLLIPTLLDSGFRVKIRDTNDWIAIETFARKWYPLCGHGETRWVGPINVVSPDENIDADVVFVSVKEDNLSNVAIFLNNYIDDNVPIYVVENATSADILLQNHLNKINAENYFNIHRGIANVIVPISPFEKDDPLYTVHDFNGKLILEHVEDNYAPTLNHAIYMNEDDFNFEWEMKLFLHCALHVVAGYVGIRNGLEYVHEAVHEPDVVNVANGIANALTIRHRGRRDAIRKRLEEELSAMSDALLADDVHRVVRDPCRKLAPDDRLIGTLALLLKHTPDAFDAIEIVSNTTRYMIIQSMMDYDNFANIEAYKKHTEQYWLSTMLFDDDAYAHAINLLYQRLMS